MPPIRSINLGLRLTQQTTVTISLPGLDATAVAQIARGGSTQFVAIPPVVGGIAPATVFQSALTAGDYVLIVDSTLRPGQQGAFLVTTDVDVSFWSAAHPDPGTDPRPWQGGTGNKVIAQDVKDPWPDPGARTVLSDALLQSSSIAGTMRALLDANAGRGAGQMVSGPATFALLIGIDQYTPGASQAGAIYPKLRGCVNDIMEVEKLLVQRVPGIQITRLIAPLPERAGGDIAVPADRVPTYSNIVAAWQRVTATAQPNDVVYIHYAGHGGCAKTQFPAFKPAGVDESLVPCDIHDRDRGQYLRDVEVALLLQRMAERGLVTTVVLDSCHSGSATRGDQAQARQGYRSDTEPRGSDVLPSAVGTADELAAIAQQLAQRPRDATWHVDPSGTLTTNITVIAACRQTEAAYEYAPDGGKRYGALTYFWRQALAQATATSTYRRIHDQVFGNVHNVFAAQTPLLLGNPDRVVLGRGVLVSQPAVPVVKVTGDQVELGAGASTLLAPGMHLALVPPDQIAELVELADMVDVEVRSVAGSSATALRTPGSGGGAAIAVGAQGIVRSYPPRMQRAIRLIEPPDAPPDLFAALRARIAADPSKLLTVTAGDGGDFQVIVDGAPASFRICDPSGAALPHLPATPIGAGDAAERVVDQLVHLARYSNVMALTNGDPSASLAGQLEVTVLGLPNFDPLAPAPLHPVPLPDGPVRLPNGAFFCLRVRNRSSQFLQFAVIDLQPDWGISSFLSDNGDLAPGETRDIALQAKLPDGLISGRDVLKVLATQADGRVLRPALLSLPALGQPRRPPEPRAPHEAPLDELLRILQDPLQGQRNVMLPQSPSRGWTIARTEIEVTSEVLATAEVR